MADNLTVLSYSDLRESAAAIQREVERREGMDQAARTEQFGTELAEIRAGTRRVNTEHVAYLTPQEVEAAVNNGQVPGVGPDRRVARRR